MFPLYVIALCSVAIAIGVFVNIVLNLRILRNLRERKEARTVIYSTLRSRISRLENAVRVLLRKTERISDSKFKSPDSKLHVAGGSNG